MIVDLKCDWSFHQFEQVQRSCVETVNMGMQETMMMRSVATCGHYPMKSCRQVGEAPEAWIPQKKNVTSQKQISLGVLASTKEKIHQVRLLRPQTRRGYCRFAVCAKLQGLKNVGFSPALQRKWNMAISFVKIGWIVRAKTCTKTLPNNCRKHRMTSWKKTIL